MYQGDTFGGNQGNQRDRDLGNTTRPPTPRTTVGSAQNEQSALLSQAHQALGALEDRLRPVLSHPAGGPAGTGGVSKEPGTVLEVIQSQNSVIQVLINRIEDIGQRVEL